MLILQSLSPWTLSVPGLKNNLPNSVMRVNMNCKEHNKVMLSRPKESNLGLTQILQFQDGTKTTISSVHKDRNHGMPEKQLSWVAIRPVIPGCQNRSNLRMSKYQ